MACAVSASPAKRSFEVCSVTQHPWEARIGEQLLCAGDVGSRRFQRQIGTTDANRHELTRWLARAIEQPVDDELAIDEFRQRLTNAQVLQRIGIERLAIGTDDE